MIRTIAEYAGYIASIIAAIGIFIKPVRDKLFGLTAIVEAEKCTLRNQMLTIYRENHENKSLEEDEYKNFKMLYDAYRALGGNSFIVKIWREIDEEWSVIV